MNKQCPNCGSTDIYRCHPHSLELHCDRCNYRWYYEQVATPILKHKFWLSKPLKGWHHLEVWRCPGNPQKFAYRSASGGSLFGNLQGEFETPQSAKEAGIREAQRLPAPTQLNEFEPLKQTARNCYVARRNQSSTDAENQQIYAAYLLELESIERLELRSKIRESKP
jgi:ribosomal protein S27AE